MRSQKIRLKLTKEQESLTWWYSKISRNFWNLLVDIDKRNNIGEFDEILNKNENDTYYSKFHDRDIYKLNQSDYLNLAKIVVAKNSEKDSEIWSWYYKPNQSFIYKSLSKELVKKQPQYIAIEDLNVKGMMKNKYLAKDIANCSFYTIREHLIRKATERCISVRLVGRFYPSSKTCSNCGSYKKDLKLSQRVFHCNNCHEKIDRDFNASLNIAKTDKYVLA